MRRFFVFAMILGMAWSADNRAAASNAAPELSPVPAGRQTVFGPWIVMRGRSSPAAEVDTFTAPPGDAYTLVVEDLGPTGALVQLWLNGRQLVGERDLAGSGRAAHTATVSLAGQNEVVVLLAGKPGSSVRVTIYGAVETAAWEQPCDGLGDLFTQPPVPPDLLRAVVPLGALNPPVHTLPAPHLSLSSTVDAFGVAEEVPVYAPGRATLMAVERRSVDGVTDVSVHLQACSKVRAALRHLSRLAAELEASILERGERHCVDPATCIDAVSIEVDAGSLLGHGGGPGRPAVALTVEDEREVLAFANPDRYLMESAPSLLSSSLPPDVLARVLPNRLSAVCGLDYFDAETRLSLEGMLASADGLRRRVAAPLCGDHMQDVPGTAQGNWFTGTADNAIVDESTAAALVHDHVDPSVGIFSFGSGVYLGPGTYSFIPASGGSINTDFDLVTPGFVYCYDELRYNGAALGGSVLLEVFSEPPGVSNRLRLEYRWRPCTTRPWSFGPWAQLLQR